MTDYSEAEIDKAYEIVNSVREKERAEARARASAFVGRCFKTKNSYSGDHGSWWLYAVALSVSDYGHLKGFEFQRKKDRDHDSIEITADASLITLVSDSSRGGWKEIPRQEFEAAFTEVLAAARELHQAVDAVDPVASNSREPSTRDKGI